MFQIPTLYFSYEELLLDIDIYGKILEETSVSRSDLKDLLFEEYKRTHPLPSLEDKRYEMSRLVSMNYHIQYSESVELVENEHIIESGEVFPDYSESLLSDKEIVVPDDIAEKFKYELSTTEDYKNIIVEEMLKSDLESLTEDDAKQATEVFNTTENYANVYDFDGKDMESSDLSSNLDEDLTEADYAEYTYYDDSSTEEDTVSQDKRCIEGDEESNFCDEDSTQSNSADTTYVVDSADNVEDDYFDDEELNNEDNAEDDEAEDEYDEYDEDDDAEEAEDNYFDDEELNNEDNAEDDEAEDEYDEDDDAEEAEDDEGDEGDEDDEGGDGEDGDEDADDDEDAYDAGEEPVSSTGEGSNKAMIATDDTLTSNDNFRTELKDEDDLLVNDISDFFDESIQYKAKAVIVPTPAEVSRKNKPVAVEQASSSTSKVDRSSEPKDLREFIRKYPRCEVSFVLNYFSRNEIEKALRMGKIIKKGTKLHI